MDLRRRSGFTLVELLVVIAIIAVLASIVAVGLIPMRKKAYKEKSRAFIQKIQTAIDSYYAEFRDYPPDGYDAEPGWGAAPLPTGVTGVTVDGIVLGPPAKGRRYKGSACLIYFLCFPLTNVTQIGADMGSNDPRQRREKVVGPFLSDVPREAFSAAAWDESFDPAIGPGSADYKDAWAKCELLDAWQRPIHYDRLKEGVTWSFSATVFKSASKTHADQTYWTTVTNNFTASDERLCPTDTHDTVTESGTSSIPELDPRAPAESDGCVSATGTPSPRNRNSYDIWSHGPSLTNPREAITNWGR